MREKSSEALGSGSDRYLSWKCRLPSCCKSPAVENFINEPLRPDIFHVHLQRRLHQCRKIHLKAIFLMPTSFDAIVHESNKPSSHNGADIQ